MAATILARKPRVSASEKPCLYHAKVGRLAATIAGPTGKFKFYPVGEPYVGKVPAYAVSG